MKASVEEILEIAVNLATSQERATYLHGACGIGTELRREVDSLLESHERAGSFLPIDPGEAAVTLPEQPLSEGPGSVIDRSFLKNQSENATTRK